MESEMKKDDGFAVTYTTGDVPTYTSAHYTTDMHGYYTDIDWQNGNLDPTRPMYTRQEMPTIPFYPGYQTVTHADIYPGSNLWHPADSSLQVAADANISHTLNVRRENPRSGTTSTGRPKRRRTQSLTQRRAANVRERRRMFQLNEAFDALRKKLPAFNYEKRLSRIETLRLAMTYISFMQEVTTGADPKHIKLLSYQTEDSNHAHDLSLHQNGCHSPISENDMDIGIHGEHVVENVTLTPVDVQPQSELKELQSVSAVHVELLPSVPVKISLPATNLEVLTEEPPQNFAEEQSVSDE